MAYQTGIINYKGSFKSIRNYTNVGDPKIYAGEKGGANRLTDVADTEQLLQDYQLKPTRQDSVL